MIDRIFCCFVFFLNRKAHFSFLFLLAQNRKIFAEQDAERAMVFLLLSENDEVRIASCQALAVMAESMLSRETIRNNGSMGFSFLFDRTNFSFRRNFDDRSNDAKR